MKKRTSLFLTLTLALSLCAPALAWEYPPRKYASWEEYMAFYRSCEDADTQRMVAWLDDFFAADPNFAANFDGDAYFEQNMAALNMGISKGNWICDNDFTYVAGSVESCFRAEMLDICLTGRYRAWKDTELPRLLAEQYPERYAAFDPNAWFEGYYGRAGANRTNYMTNWWLDEEGFKRKMFMEWAEKAPTSFFGGYCVTVDGAPIYFQDYRGLSGEPAAPRAENDRLLVPLRAAAESLGLAVDYLPETGQVTCAGTGGTVTFTLDSTAYSGGVLDAAPFAEDGVTYLPLRALGETLGCGVAWDQDFATAALTTPKS